MAGEDPLPVAGTSHRCVLSNPSGKSILPGRTMKLFNVGIVGYGWAAGAHLDAINRGGLGQVTAICSTRNLDAKELSTRHGCPLRCYSDFESMLRDPDLHAISICSYHKHHTAQAIAAARAGKHLIVEKPLALSLADMRAIEGAVREAGVQFCICFELRFSTQFRAIKAAIDQGLLGHVHYGEIDYYHGIGPWYREYEWCTSNDECGSSLLAAGCHAMDALLLCMPGEVEEVYCCGSNSKNAVFAKYEYPSSSVTLLKFRDGRVGKVASVIDCWQPYYFHTHLVGSEGSLLDNKFHSNKIAGLDKHAWSQFSFKPVDSGDVSDHPYQTQFDAFFEALRRKENMPLTGLDEAIRTHEVIFAADRSLAEGRPVKISEIRTQN